MPYTISSLLPDEKEVKISSYTNEEYKNDCDTSSFFTSYHKPDELLDKFIIKNMLNAMEYNKDIIISRNPFLKITHEEQDISLYQEGNLKEKWITGLFKTKKSSDPLIEQAKNMKEKKEKWITNLFGKMRNLTGEEQENYNKSLLEISEPTGKKFWD